MSNTIQSFFLSNRFIGGLLVGLSFVLLIASLLWLPAIIDRNTNEISTEDCTYGLHSDFFGQRCIYHSEMQENLGCENFFLRDGYWWQCIPDDVDPNADMEMVFPTDITKITTQNMTEHSYYLEMPSDRFFNVEWKNDPVEIWWVLQPYPNDDGGGKVVIEDFTLSISGFDNDSWNEENSKLYLTSVIPDSDDALFREVWKLSELNKTKSQTEQGFDYNSNYNGTVVMKKEGRDSPKFNLFLEFTDYQKESGYLENKVIHIRFDIKVLFADGYRVSTSDAVYITFFDDYKPEPQEYSEWYFNNVGSAYS